MWSDLTPDQKADAIRSAIRKKDKNAAEIAERLGTTRNAIIGCCTRRGIKLPNAWTEEKKRVAKSLPKSKPKSRDKSKPKADPSSKRPSVKGEVQDGFIPKIGNELQPLKTLRTYKSGKECNWVIGPVNGLDTGYCGRPVSGKARNWCEHHRKVGNRRKNKTVTK